MSKSKNVYYFPHPADLRNDLRLKRIMRDFQGLVGYGAVLFLLEHLRCQPNYRYPMKDLDFVAKECETSLEMLKTIIKEYDIFIITTHEDEELFSSPLLDEWMIPYDEKVKNNRIAGKVSAKKRRIKEREQLEKLRKMQKQINKDYADTDAIPNISDMS